MSGGSHEYAYLKLEEMAEDFQPHRKQDHFKERGRFADILELCAEIAHDIEWIDSGDYGDEKWEEIIKKIIQLKTN